MSDIDRLHRLSLEEERARQNEASFQNLKALNGIQKMLKERLEGATPLGKLTLTSLKGSFDAYDDEKDYTTQLENTQKKIETLKNDLMNNLDDIAKKLDPLQLADTFAFVGLDIHNYNCYRYLSNLKEPAGDFLPYANTALKGALEAIDALDTYDSKTPYGDRYSTLLTQFSSFELPIDADDEQKRSYYQLITAIYDNDNNILEHTAYHLSRVLQDVRPQTGSPKATVAMYLANTKSQVNAFGPQDAESSWARFQATTGREFRPMLKTSLPTVRRYCWHKDEGEPTELRFGTQAEIFDGTPRVNPLFEAFITAKARLITTSLEAEASEEEIDHIYFNLLGRDRGWDILGEGSRETSMTNVLEKMEKSHPNIAVITLPADKGLMSKHDFAKTKPAKSVSEYFKTFLHIALEDDKHIKTKDFHISEHVRKKLFGTKEGDIDSGKQRQQLRLLLEASFKATLGIDAGEEKDLLTKLSPAQAQAVWFHFNKYELPKFIIQTLNAESFNFSCKDAIDRGGVMSAYYNLMQSFTTDTPMSPQEFDQALHAAAAIVKGRGLNHHLNLIWNAVDCYVTANYDTLKDAPQKAWLISWRELNTPRERITTKYIQAIIEKRTKTLQDSPGSKLKSAAIALLKKINQHIGKAEVSNKRLLLETITRVSDGVLSPRSDVTSRHFEKLHQDIKAESKGGLSRFWKAVGSFFASVLTLFQHQKSVASLSTYGYSSSPNSFFERQSIADKMEKYKEQLDRAPTKLEGELEGQYEGEKCGFRP